MIDRPQIQRYGLDGASLAEGCKDGQGAECEGQGEAERRAFSALKREGFVRTLLLLTATSLEDTKMEANTSQSCIAKGNRHRLEHRKF